MKNGTRIQVTLITDSRFIPEDKCLPAVIGLFDQLATDIEGKMEIVNEQIEPRRLEWPAEKPKEWDPNPVPTIQYRIHVYLKTLVKLTQNDIYRIVNRIQAQPLKFS